MILYYTIYISCSGVHLGFLIHTENGDLVLGHLGIFFPVGGFGEEEFSPVLIKPAVEAILDF
jgi:hypothetical protein